MLKLLICFFGGWRGGSASSSSSSSNCVAMATCFGHFSAQWKREKKLRQTSVKGGGGEGAKGPAETPQKTTFSSLCVFLKKHPLFPAQRWQAYFSRTFRGHLVISVCAHTNTQACVRFNTKHTYEAHKNWHPLTYSHFLWGWELRVFPLNEWDA